MAPNQEVQMSKTKKIPSVGRDSREVMSQLKDLVDGMYVFEGGCDSCDGLFRTRWLFLIRNSTAAINFKYLGPSFQVWP